MFFTFYNRYYSLCPTCSTHVAHMQMQTRVRECFKLVPASTICVRVLFCCRTSSNFIANGNPSRLSDKFYEIHTNKISIRLLVTSAKQWLVITWLVWRHAYDMCHEAIFLHHFTNMSSSLRSQPIVGEVKMCDARVTLKEKQFKVSCVLLHASQIKG